MALKYRLDHLGWESFEELAVSLLKVLVGPAVSWIGGPGDGGVDASFRGRALALPSESEPWDGSWVFQVKHTDAEVRGATSARRSLIATVRSEVARVCAQREGVWVDNYVLVTNVPLTKSAREQIEQCIEQTRFCERLLIIDGRDICGSLDTHPDLRRAFPQLLTLADIDVVVNKEVFERSRWFLDAAKIKLQGFVRTRLYDLAAEVLRNKHFIVLSGPPETGKTTIATALAAGLATSGHEVVDVQSPGDVHRSFAASRSQVFVSDDVLGALSLSQPSVESWSRELAGIRSRLDAKHLLIWTVRTNVMHQALSTTRLGEDDLSFPGEFGIVVDVAGLSRLERARIVRSHAAYAPFLSAGWTLTKRMCDRISKNVNFTPERVRQTFGGAMEDLCENGILTWRRVSEFLRSPSRRWINAYNALSPSDKWFLLSVLQQGAMNEASEVQRAFESRMVTHHDIRFTYAECLHHLSNAFVSLRVNSRGKQTIVFQHASIAEILLNHLETDMRMRAAYISAAGPAGVVSILRRAIKVQEPFQRLSVTERILLRERIEELVDRSMPSADWRHMLSIVRISWERSRTVNADKLRFDVGGVIQGAFQRRATYLKNDYSFEEWADLLVEHGRSSRYKACPEYLADVVARMTDDCNAATRVQFCDAVYRYAPDLLVAVDLTGRKLIARDLESIVVSIVNLANEITLGAQRLARRTDREGQIFLRHKNVRVRRFESFDKTAGRILESIDQFSRWSQVPMSSQRQQTVLAIEAVEQIIAALPYKTRRTNEPVSTPT